MLLNATIPSLPSEVSVGRTVRQAASCILAASIMYSRSIPALTRSSGFSADRMWMCVPFRSSMSIGLELMMRTASLLAIIRFRSSHSSSARVYVGKTNQTTTRGLRSRPLVPVRDPARVLLLRNMSMMQTQFFPQRRWAIRTRRFAPEDRNCSCPLCGPTLSTGSPVVETRSFSFSASADASSRIGCPAT